MPKQYRYALKQQLNRALKSLQYAEDAIVKVGHQYKDKYPKRYAAFCTSIQSIAFAKDLIEKLRDSI